MIASEFFSGSLNRTSKQRYCVSHGSVYLYTFLALVTHSEVATFQLNDTYMGASAEQSGLEKHL